MNDDRQKKALRVLVETGFFRHPIVIKINYELNCAVQQLSETTER